MNIFKWLIVVGIAVLTAFGVVKIIKEMDTLSIEVW